MNLIKISGYSSFFDKAICRFDDYGIPEYLNDFVVDKFINIEESKYLKLLSDKIDSFCEKELTVIYYMKNCGMIPNGLVFQKILKFYF